MHMTSMIKRALVWLAVAVLMAVLGFSGVLQVTAVFARFLCFVAAGFCALSLLFSLFEETETSERALTPDIPAETAR